MLAEISAGLGSLKAAFDVTKALNGALTQAAVNDVKIDLQTHILDANRALFAAQEAQTAAADRIRQLEQQIAGCERWQVEKQRYALRAIDTGAFAYMLKPGMEHGEPAQWLCTSCFEKGQKGRLNFSDQMTTPGGRRGMHAKWTCDTCSRCVQVYYTRKPSKSWSPEFDAG